MILLTVIVFILIFSLLILVHELGHFWAAKRAGVKVEEFGFGLPPRIFGVKRGETIYSLNWIPFGGFVRMLGEDSAAGKRSKRSINNQPLRVQAWVVSAGVVMNLLLAWVLLSFGLVLGMEPLLVNQEDLMNAVHEGSVELHPGFVVEESEEPYRTVVHDGEDLQIRSFEPGDRIVSVDGKDLLSVEQWEAVLLALEEEGGSVYAGVEYARGASGAEYLTAELAEQITVSPFYMSRLVYNGDEDSILSGYLQRGDVLLQVGGFEIFNEGDLEEAVVPGAGLLAYRPNEGTFIEIDEVAWPQHMPVITYVLEDGPADLVGVEVGDELVSFNGASFNTAPEFLNYLKDLRGLDLSEAFELVVERNGERFVFKVALDESGYMRIALDDPVRNYGNLDLYPQLIPHSMGEIHKTSYGLGAAVVEAVKELWRLGVLTAVMFVTVLKNFVTGGGMPAGVAGPVGIAQMTFLTLQDGFTAVLRFVALLSLSLGVINILPIPALDGGRLIFILFEALTGKRPSPKLEHWIHSAGFAFLLLFLAYVTFNDVLNLF